MKRILLALALLPHAALALPESELAGKKSELLDNKNNFYVAGKFRGAGQAALGYVRFGRESGPAGCLVISPGQGEASLKYIEVALDLSRRGFSPIYSLDHRGQGFSSRLLPNRQKSHVAKFSDYVTDFTRFVNEIVLANPACRGRKLSLLAHSMGGAIAMAYLEQEGAHSPFERVAMSAPMLKIRYPIGKNEDSVIAETFVACHTPFGPACTDFAPGKGPYNPSAPFAENTLTHSRERFQLKKDIFARWARLQVGGPTVGWVRQSAISNKEMRRRYNAWKVASPLLILQATNDSLVDNAGQDELCGDARDCKIEKVEGAYHEILMESDRLRDPALTRIAAFLSGRAD